MKQMTRNWIFIFGAFLAIVGLLIFIFLAESKHQPVPAPAPIQQQKFDRPTLTV